MELVFIHGWGFDKSFWDKLCPLLPQHRHRLVDLGFFGTPSDGFNFPPESCVLVGHSLGFVRALREKHDWSGWVAINSFPRFVRNNSKSGCVPEFIVREMRERLQKNPDKILQDFHRMIGTAPPSNKFNLERLCGGLDELLDIDISEIVASLDVPGLVLASKNDPLVPAAISEELGSAQQAQIERHDTGGHALPLNNPEWCATQIADFLARNFPST